MLTYDPFWETLRHKNISTYKLINTYKISPGVIQNIRNNKPLNLKSVDELCRILGCEEITEIVKLDKEKK